MCSFRITLLVSNVYLLLLCLKKFLMILLDPISKDLSDRMLKSFTMKPSFKGTTLDGRLVSTWAMIPAVLFPNRLARVSELSHIYFERGLI